MRPLDRLIDGLAYALALAGGVALLALALMVAASIVGRALVPLGLGPVPGDYELVELGAGFAVFAMLPWCQRRRGHVRVELLKPLFGPRLNRALDLAAAALTAGVALLLAWRLALGLRDKLGDGFYVETTFILGLPVWWGYAAALPGAVAFALAAFWSLTGRG
jgi:TRAP-type C4-dicarboxylate transport system permease small subunit